MHDIVLTPWTADTAKARSAFRRKNAWVVDAPQSSALWYKAVLSNLTCRYIQPQDTTIGSVREILLAGLGRSAFERLKLITNVSNEELSKTVGISKRTLSRRRKKFSSN